jgi:hypothetical protein
MSYLAIADFKFGQDRRRKRVTGVPGTLWNLVNAHITRGGDIERNKKFVEKYELPEGTFGLAKLGRQLYAFGSADLAGSMPIGVEYQRLIAPSTPDMVRVLDAKAFDKLLYVIAEYDDGNIYHFYNATRVTEWDALATANSSLATLALYLSEKINSSDDVTSLVSGSTILVTANEAGTAFTMSGGVVDRGADNTQTNTVTTVVANVVEVEEVRATGTVTITGGSNNPDVNMVEQVTVDGVELMEVEIDWILSNSATASAVATEINNRTATHGFTALAVGAAITITAEVGTGAGVNGDVVAVDVAGTVTASTANLSGGVTYVAPVAQVSKAVLGGAYEAEDEFTVTINGTAYIATGQASGTGVNVYPQKGRVWSVAGTLLNGCKLNDPTDWSDADASIGFVSIDVSSQSDGTERLVGMETYQEFSAVFSQTEIRLYTLDADATAIVLAQSLNNTGSLAGRAIVSYGNNDVFYPDTSGIRSLRQRDNVNAAFVSDVGNAIDVFVREHIDTLPNDTVARAVALVEPIDGRLWVSIGERIYVLSYFPSSKVNAWSYYEPPVSITELVRIGSKVYARGGDTVYLYGGDFGATYPEEDEQIVEVELPFLTAEKPANLKTFMGYDTALDNEWLVSVLPDPNDEEKEITVGRINRNTFHLDNVALPVRSSCIAVNLTCSQAGAATLSALTLHFNAQEAPK